jgi:hypothetical protein
MNDPPIDRLRDQSRRTDEAALSAFELGARAHAHVARRARAVLMFATLAVGMSLVTTVVREPRAAAQVARMTAAHAATEAAPAAMAAPFVAMQPAVTPVVDLSSGTTSATARVLSIIDRIRSNLRSSTYRHTLRVNERVGLYDFDCSAMASWILSRSAPRALATVGGGRPLAVDFFRTIVRAPADRPRSGWQRVARVIDARPGDVLAWQRPRWFPSHNTGHVAFVVGDPEPFANGVLLRIADASSYNHEDDSRGGSTGFGTGVILVTTDPATGEGTGYGWFGRGSGEWVVPTPVVIGRPQS